MQVSGTITLDDKSKERLMDEAREQVLKDMMEDGCYYSEVQRFLASCSFDDYACLIKQSIDKVIERTNPKDIRFDSEELAWKRLLAVQKIFEIC
ncbi:MAG: hypothetical protein ACI4UK_09625 [Floccifex sp.]